MNTIADDIVERLADGEWPCDQVEIRLQVFAPGCDKARGMVRGVGQDVPESASGAERDLTAPEDR